MLLVEWLRRLSPQRRQVARALRAARDLPPVTLTGCLKVRPNRIVCTGKMNGRAVIVKSLMGPNAERLTRATQEVLEDRYPALGPGPHRVPEPLAFSAKHGITIMEQVPGTALSAMLRTAPPDERARLIARAGTWLDRYCADSRRVNPTFGGRNWLAMAARKQQEFRHEPDALLAKALVGALVPLAAGLSGRPVRQAIIHGDFRTHNLLVDDATICGVDLHNTGYLPVARDAAGFLVHLSSHIPATDRLSWNGVSTTDADALLATDLLSDIDPRLVRFFIGVSLIWQLSIARPKSRVAGETRAMIHSYLSSTT